MAESVFSSLKAAWHTGRIEELRAGRDIVPTHVQLILSDRCNQNCVPAGTMIECSDGIRTIETIRVGDLVIGPDGTSVAVTDLFDTNRVSIWPGDEVSRPDRFDCSLSIGTIYQSPSHKTILIAEV